MKPTLLGDDLAPLPGESLYSILARIAWENVLTPNQLRKLLSVSGQHVPLLPDYRRINTLRHLVWEIEQVTGWASSSIYPPGISALDVTGWFEQEFVFCPACAAGFYHSHWQQLKGMQRCPIHDRELVRYCMTCGHQLGRYELSNELFSRPYCCTACGTPLGGTPLQLREMMAFREAHSNLAQVFGPWRRWSRGVMARLGRLSTQADQFKDLSHRKWWSPQEITTAVTHHFHSSPPGCIVPQVELSWLSWVITPLSMRNRFRPHYIASQRRENTYAYRALLSELQKWIMEITTIPTLSRRPEFFDSRGKLCREGWSTEALAYMLLRRMWERAFDWSLAAPVDRADIPGAFFHPYPMLDSYEYDDLMVRALTLSIFASYYWMIERSSVLDIDRFYINDSSAVFMHSMETQPQFGVICFPKIPGLPLNGFSPARLRLDDAWELYLRTQKMKHVRGKWAYEKRDELEFEELQRAIVASFYQRQAAMGGPENPHSSP